jgi:hypothetical protein
VLVVAVRGGCLVVGGHAVLLGSRGPSILVHFRVVRRSASVADPL